MGYPMHSNNDVLNQLIMRQTPTKDPLILGCFREDSGLSTFEYAERRHPDDNFAPDMPHIVYVSNDGQYRLAKVLKTVAYVVTDEDEDGNPVIEKWNIRSHRNYDTSWVLQKANEYLNKYDAT